LKATGQLQGEEMFEVTYEGYGPHGVAILLQCMTDNRNRTVSEVRHAFNKYNGTLGTSGSVSYLFNRVAKIVLADTDEDQVIEAILEHDISEVITDNDHVVIIADPAELNPICETLTGYNWPIIDSEVTMMPMSEVELTTLDAEKVEKLIDALDDLDDIQAVHHNLQVAE
jgi:YebC/PmpR family DNA-binding regulatory protein